MSNNWPTVPLIRVIRGRDLGELKENMIAARVDESGNYIGARCAFTREADRDSIDEWEEVTPVPTAALEELEKAWHGDGEYTPTGLKTLGDAVAPILACLPADKPSALDRAVTRVKDAGGPMIDADSLPADRLSLLLDALASVQRAAHKTAPLTMVARICADWVQADNPEKIALEQMRSRAASIPEVVGSDPARFIVLAGYIGDAANMLSNAHLDVSGQLTNAGTYALAWAAEIIKEEDK